MARVARRDPHAVAAGNRAGERQIVFRDAKDPPKRCLTVGGSPSSSVANLVSSSWVGSVTTSSFVKSRSGLFPAAAEDESRVRR